MILHNAADYIWMIGENYEDYDISEQGFVQRRTDLGLEATQKFIGEEYHKKDDHKEFKKPKKFVKTEPTFKVSVDDGDDGEETEEEIAVGEHLTSNELTSSNESVSDECEVEVDENESAETEPFEIG